MGFLSVQWHGERVKSPGNWILKELSNGLKENLLYVTAEHGDFHPRNVFVREDGSLVVLDWDDYRPAGNPLFDLGLFLWGLSTGYPHEFPLLLKGKGPAGVPFRAGLETIKSAVGLSERCVYLAIGYALVRLLLRDGYLVREGEQQIRLADPRSVNSISQRLETLQEFVMSLRQ